LKPDNITRLLKLISRHDVFGEVWWDENLSFRVNCNDVFAWAVSDAELVTDDSLSDLERALDEAGDIDGLYLYVARRRGMRPQGAMYKHIEEKNWPLFNLCGPEREAGMFNPIKGP